MVALLATGAMGPILGGSWDVERLMVATADVAAGGWEVDDALFTGEGCCYCCCYLMVLLANDIFIFL